MKLAAYQGISRISKCIRFICRSKYSHIALLFDDDTEAACPDLRYQKAGAIVEAWDGVGVRNRASLSDGHSPGTTVDVFRLTIPTDSRLEKRLIAAILPEMGKPYDWKNCLLCDPFIRVVFELRGLRWMANLIWNREAWFCSELAHHVFKEAGIELLARIKSDEVSPRDVVISPLLQFDYSVVTT